MSALPEASGSQRKPKHNNLETKRISHIQSAIWPPSTRNTASGRCCRCIENESRSSCGFPPKGGKPNETTQQNTAAPCRATNRQTHAHAMCASTCGNMLSTSACLQAGSDAKTVLYAFGTQQNVTSSERRSHFDTQTAWDEKW